MVHFCTAVHLCSRASWLSPPPLSEKVFPTSRSQLASQPHSCTYEPSLATENSPLSNYLKKSLRGPDQMCGTAEEQTGCCAGNGIPPSKKLAIWTPKKDRELHSISFEGASMHT